MKKQKENSHEGITRSEMGKQNVQAEKVYWIDGLTELQCDRRRTTTFTDTAEMTASANTYISDKPNVSLLRVWKSIKNQSIIVKKLTQLCGKMLAKPTKQLYGVFPKLLPPTGGTINAFAWKLGTKISAHGLQCRPLIPESDFYVAYVNAVYRATLSPHLCLWPTHLVASYSSPEPHWT